MENLPNLITKSSTWPLSRKTRHQRFRIGTWCTSQRLQSHFAPGKHSVVGRHLGQSPAFHAIVVDLDWPLWILGRELLAAIGIGCGTLAVSKTRLATASGAPPHPPIGTYVADIQI
jgi:hypothetical protein